MQQLPEDFRDLLCLLNEHSVEYLIVGYNDLVKNKRASGRLRDLADLEGLGEEST